MSLKLDRPTSVDELYLDRADPIDAWRPIMQGDVFADVTITDLDAHDLVIIVSHPCSMRGAGGQLHTRLQAVPVDSHPGVDLAAWSAITRIFPLPELRVGSPDDYAARLTEFGMVSSAQLDLDRRIACLSERGILLLQQKFVASLTRVGIGLDALDTACRSVLVEAELLEDWLGAFAATRTENGEDRGVALAAEAFAFDEYLSPLRPQLEDEAGRSAVRRQVRGEIVRRRAALDNR